MKVEAIYSTPIWVCEKAGRTCVDAAARVEHSTRLDSREYVRKLIDKGHESVIEHLSYTFEIKGLSRAALQELARHRIASYSVKSTRWTLKKLAGKATDVLLHPEKYIRLTGIRIIDDYNMTAVSAAADEVIEHPNDVTKYILPEAFLTDLVMTINARSLRNFFRLRTGKTALAEMQELSRAMFDALSVHHKVFFEDVVNG